MTTGPYNSFKRNFGRNLALLRREKGLTQEKLAHMVKMDPVSISYIETAQRGPSFETIYKLSKVLEIDPKRLFQF